MNELTKVEYSKPQDNLYPVKVEDFPVDTFISNTSEIGRYYLNDKDKPIVEIQKEKFIERFNELCYVYGNPELNAPYFYNPETKVWEEIILGNFKFNEWYYENALQPFFRDLLLDDVFGNKIGDSLKDVAKSLATRAMTRGGNSPLGDKPNANTIAFTNGTYDFTTNELRETRLEDYHTLQLPYDLIKEEDESKILAVDWMKFVLEDNAKAMFEWIGYMYYREYKYQNIAFLINDPLKSKSGSNGKSQVGGFIVDKLFGHKNTSAVGLDLLADAKNRFDKASLHHKLVNFEADSSANFMSGTNTLKKLSGGRDTIHAENKGTRAFSFINYAKLMFSMNELPAFSDRTNGWYRRLLIIPFPKDFSTDKYEKELQYYNSTEDKRNSKEQLGMFAWYCIQQYRKILLKGANGDNPFTETQRMKEMKQAYIEGNNPANEFISEVPVLVREEEAIVPVSVVKNIFTVYTKENNVNKTMNWKTMKGLLESIGFVETNVRPNDTNDLEKVTRCYKGLKVGANGDSLSIEPYLRTALASSEYVNIFNTI